MPTLATQSTWQYVGRVAATGLVDARQQLHHALQIIVSAPISYLEKRADDSHTNLEWLPELKSLGTNWLERGTRMRLALRPETLSLLAIDANEQVVSEFTLSGQTTDGAVAWLRGVLTAAGYDRAAFTTHKHYEIPSHPVAFGATYDLGDAAPFAELGRYYSNAHWLTSRVAAARSDAAPPRCWPHHFDLATLITLPRVAGRTDRSVGVGLSPGDDSYAEPYFYVGPYPHPRTDRLRPLGSLGTWHTHGWVGAVLRGSEIAAFDEPRQGDAVRAFADAAIEASIEALR